MAFLNFFLSWCLDIGVTWTGLGSQAILLGRSIEANLQLNFVHSRINSTELLIFIVLIYMEVKSGSTNS